jgi:hypothetical protein
MIKDIQLRQFTLSGDWRPLISRLDGWNEISDNLFSDGESSLTLRQRTEDPPALGFVFGGYNIDNAPVSLVSPSGILLNVTERPAFMRSPTQNRMVMNHAAFQVPTVEDDRVWFEEVLGHCTVLARESVWDPIARTWWPDAHLFRPSDFYLTIRGNFTSSQVDHIGWMAYSMESIDDTAALLHKLGWPVLFGPEHIDGSYLVHFRGPDERVHDFFYPTPAVMPHDREIDVPVSGHDQTTGND